MTLYDEQRMCMKLLQQFGVAYMDIDSLIIDGQNVRRISDIIGDTPMSSEEEM